MRWVIAMVLLVSWDVAGQPKKEEVTIAQAKKILPDAPASCGDIPCMLEASYAKDPKAKALALAIHADNGSVAGVGPDEIMDGGYRGKIHLVPELPIDELYISNFELQVQSL